jgi:hypothetical protein
MTKDASTLLAAAIKSATLTGSFSPAEVGARVGLDKVQSELAARWLANAGVLELGFDSAAHFTAEYRKAHAPPPAAKKAAPKAPRKRARISAGDR